MFTTFIPLGFLASKIYTFSEQVNIFGFDFNKSNENLLPKSRITKYEFFKNIFSELKSMTRDPDVMLIIIIISFILHLQNTVLKFCCISSLDNYNLRIGEVWSFISSFTLVMRLPANKLVNIQMQITCNLAH